jgi:pSer/pThr/pTyr-binding forkhead associated (FHA) protein
MPKIAYKQKDNSVQEYRLQKNTSMTIGREDDNDIILRHVSVSAHHAEIESDGDLFLLTDRQSRNGTFINRQLVISRPLKHKDVITIGNQTLVFLYDADEKQPENVEEDFIGKTMAIDTKAHRAQLARGVSDMAEKQTKKVTVGVLTYLSGGTGEIVLSKDSIKIGKRSSSDIVVHGLMMGKTAAVISKEEDTYFLRYVEGMTKPKLNYKSVKTKVRLQEYDVIEMGALKLQFHLKKR